MRFDDTAEKTFDLSGLMPVNAGDLEVALTEEAVGGDAIYSVREDTFVYQPGRRTSQRTTCRALRSLSPSPARTMRT